MIIYSFWFLPNNLSLISSLFGKFLTIPANHGPIFLTLLNIRIPEVISDLYPISGSASQEELLTENEKLKETLGFLERVRFFFSNTCDVLSFGRGCYVVFHIPSSLFLGFGDSVSCFVAVNGNPHAWVPFVCF